ncbi:MAG: DUF368 domain-containing protein [Clostridia bacterium]|nr:DUF368 domain-containing protein [Clostridia bacterium]
MHVKEFFKNAGIGAVIGVAMIIPGVSGGTVAVLLKIYDKLIGAISDLRKDFKNSFFFLLPIVLGALVAVVAAYFPLKFFIERAPLPTLLLFAGLMAGSFPKMFKDTVKTGFKPAVDIIAAVIPCALLIGICFIPSMGEVNLGVDMPVYGYFLLILIGMLASCALVVPGVSGSGLLLILGYYTSILATVSALKTDFGHSLLVLALFAVGLVVGFFSIAKLMKLLLNKFPRATGWAIIGFVIGSVPAIFLSFDWAGAVEITPVHIGVGVVLCLAGIIASFALAAYAEARTRKKEMQNGANAEQPPVELPENTSENN